MKHCKRFRSSENCRINWKTFKTPYVIYNITGCNQLSVFQVVEVELKCAFWHTLHLVDTWTQPYSVRITKAFCSPRSLSAAVLVRSYYPYYTHHLHMPYSQHHVGLPTSRGHSYYVSKDKAEARMSNCRRTTPPVVKKTMAISTSHVHANAKRTIKDACVTNTHKSIQWNSVSSRGFKLSFQIFILQRRLCPLALRRKQTGA